MLSTLNIIGLSSLLILCLWAADGRLSARFSALSGVVRLDAAIARRLPDPNMLALLLICAGLLLRVWNLSGLPLELSGEEALTGMQAQSLATTGKSLEGYAWPTMLPGWAGEGEGPLLSWLCMPFVLLLGQSAAAVRLPLALLSSFSLYALWAMARQMLGERQALWALLLCAISPWHIMQSRWALSSQALAHLVIIGLWLLGGKGSIRFLLGIFILGLGLYAGDTGWYMVPLLVILCLLYLLATRRVRLPAAIAGLLIFAVMAVPALTNLYINVRTLPETKVLGMHVPRIDQFTHVEDGILRAPTSPASANGGESEYNEYSLNEEYDDQQGWRVWTVGELLYERLMRNLIRPIQFALFEQAEHPALDARHFTLPEYGTVYLFSIPLALLGLLLYITRRARKAALPPPGPGRTYGVMMLLIVLSLLPFALTHRWLTALHFTPLLYPAILLIARGIAYITGKLRLPGLLIAGLYLAGALGFSAAYFGPEYNTQRLEYMPIGFDRAAAHAAEYGAQQVYITDYLGVYPSPRQAAQAKAQYAFKLDAAYIRGESQPENVLPYAERFHFGAPENIDPNENAVYVLHYDEAFTLAYDEALFDIAVYDLYVVLAPRSGS